MRDGCMMVGKFAGGTLVMGVLGRLETVVGGRRYKADGR